MPSHVHHNQPLSDPELPPPLDIDHIRARLAHSPIGHTIDYATAIPSTMPLAHDWITRAQTPAAAHGIVITTEEQTAGRGRRGRTWTANQGHALLTSIILSAPPITHHMHLLPMLLGLAALEAAERVAPLLRGKLGLKWPNDLVTVPTASHDPSRAPSLAKASIMKWGGILIESVYHTTPAGSSQPYAIAGIGLNVNQEIPHLPPVAPPALPPTSLRLLANHPLNRSDLLIALCTILSQRLEHIAAPHDIDAAIVELMSAWRNRLVLMHTPIHVYPHIGDPWPAIAHDVTPTGQLIVRDAHGVEHTLLAEEVSVRPAAPDFSSPNPDLPAQS